MGCMNVARMGCERGVNELLMGVNGRSIGRETATPRSGKALGYQGEGVCVCVCVLGGWGGGGGCREGGAAVA
jgi:hypothetical protein